MRRAIACFIAATAIVVGIAPPAESAQPLVVLSGGAGVAAVRRFAVEFEKAHGRSVTVTSATAGQIVAKLAAGETADVILLTAAGLDTLASRGQLADGTRVDIGKTGMGVGIRAGSAVPMLSTPEAFKQTLLSAASIASTDPAAGASSGIYFAALLQKLGIAEAVRPKETLVPGGFSCELVAAGKADLCVQNISEIVPVPGVVLAGAFPPVLQNELAYGVAVAKVAANDADARAFVSELTASGRAAFWQQAGFEPAPH
jgi:molybdate transport system substrate-binding protein